MKKIDELAESIDENLFNNIDMDEQPLSRQEIKRIHSLTMSGIHGRKRMSKKVIVSLIAAIVALTGVTAAAAGISASGRFKDYYTADTESKANIIDSVTQNVVTAPAVTEDEFSVEVAGVIGDKNGASIILDLIANDGRILDDTYRLNGVKLEFDDAKQLSGSSGGLGLFKDTDTTDNRTSFIYRIDAEGVDLSRQNVTITIDGIGRVTNGSTLTMNEINVGDLIAANKASWTENPSRMSKQGERKGFSFRDMHGKKSIEEFTDAEIDRYNTVPKLLISSQNLALPISSELKNSTLEGIGIKDNRLQLMIRYSLPDKPAMIALLNKKNDEVTKFYSGIGDSEDGILTTQYIDFIVSDGADLSDYFLIFDQSYPSASDIYNEPITLKLALNYTDTTQVIKPNKHASFGDAGFVIKRIEVSPFSIEIEIRCDDDSSYRQVAAYNSDDVITLRMNDGSIIKKFGSSGSNGGGKKNATAHFNREFANIVELKDVAAIIIGDTEIEVTLK